MQSFLSNAKDFISPHSAFKLKLARFVLKNIIVLLCHTSTISLASCFNCLHQYLSPHNALHVSTTAYLAQVLSLLLCINYNHPLQWTCILLSLLSSTSHSFHASSLPSFLHPLIPNPGLILKLGHKNISLQSAFSNSYQLTWHIIYSNMITVLYIQLYLHILKYQFTVANCYYME